GLSDNDFEHLVGEIADDRADTLVFAALRAAQAISEYFEGGCSPHQVVVVDGVPLEPRSEVIDPGSLRGQAVQPTVSVDHEMIVFALTGGAFGLLFQPLRSFEHAAHGRREVAAVLLQLAVVDVDEMADNFAAPGIGGRPGDGPRPGKGRP